MPRATISRAAVRDAVGTSLNAGTPARSTASVSSAASARASACVKKIYVDDKIKRYIVDLVFATREPSENAKLKDLAPLISYGASPRASIALNLAARAHAFLMHRAFVTPDDVKAIGVDVLRHRMHLTFEAEAQDVKSDDVVRRVFEAVPVP